PTFAAELHTRAPARNAEHLVRRRVVVMKRIDAVAPAIAPAIRVEQALEGVRVGPRRIDRAAVEEQREPTVRNRLVLFEPECLRALRHRLSPSPSIGPPCRLRRMTPF